MYNLTNVTNANTWYEIGSAANDLSGGLLFTFMMVVLMVMYMAVFKKQNFKDVFLAGSFFTTFIAVILFSMGWVAKDFLTIPILMFLAGIVIYIFNND